MEGVGVKHRERPCLADVAKVYEAAAAAGEPPTLAVRDRFGVAKSTAAGWVAQARWAGHLRPVSKGARTSRNPNALAVASALGVDYDALVDAVLHHAGGTLRFSATASPWSTPLERRSGSRDVNGFAEAQADTSNG